MATLTLFKSRATAMGYVFRSGRTVHFVNGEFATSNKAEIEELTAECESGHPCYYIDADQTTVDSEAVDPMAGMKAKWKEEGRLEALKSIARDMGETAQGKLEGIANSATIRGLAVESGTSLAPAPEQGTPAMTTPIVAAAPTAKATATKI